MPVGTNATVKSLDPEDLQAANAQVILANTYHLALRPGAGTVAALGGLHRFMRWDGPILTDSGGFQVFSLGHLSTLDDDGATFRSHLDGSTHRFTPEVVQVLQEQLGADIAMPLDQCIALPTTYDLAANAVARTTRWLERSVTAHTRTDQALFGIVQGATFQDLRVRHARELREFDLPGYAIGGLSVGEPKEQMYDTLDALHPELPADRPRYLMGVGAPEDLVEGVARGVDMFDVVLPTRIARNGTLLSRSGRINLRNAQYVLKDVPPDPECCCSTCRRFSVAYLHHLFHCEELLAYRLATIHNLWFMTTLMRDIRASILDNRFEAFRESFHASYRPPDRVAAVAQRTRRQLMQKRERDPGWHDSMTDEEAQSWPSGN